MVSKEWVNLATSAQAQGLPMEETLELAAAMLAATGVPTTTAAIQCVWSGHNGKPCNPLLPPPLTCAIAEICTSLVHYCLGEQAQL